MPDNDTEAILFMRSCARVQDALQMMARQVMSDSNVGEAIYDFSICAHDKSEWNSNPACFTWTVDVFFVGGQADTYSFDVNCEKVWDITCDRALAGKYGPEPQDDIFSKDCPTLSECAEQMRVGLEAFEQYWRRRFSLPYRHASSRA